MELEVLFARYPRLYHMAEPGSWPSIREHGLLSTSALLDRYGIHDGHRHLLEASHRPEKQSLHKPDLGRVVLRDQKPMSDERLLRCLPEDLPPTEWYRILNGKVFFWVRQERLLGLLNARAYRKEEHDVLTLDAKALVLDHVERVSLAHINTGNTFPMPHARGRDTFKTIAEYPTKARSGDPAKEVVELVVQYSVPNIRDYVLVVDRMRGGTVLQNLYRRNGY